MTAGAKVKAKDAAGLSIEIERAATAARWTFIVGKDGKIAAVGARGEALAPAIEAALKK